jgi:amino acid transporter
MVGIGWITVVAWICGCAGGFAYAANAILGLIVFNHPDFEVQPWHSTVILMGSLIVMLLLNLYLRKLVNWLETVGGILHVILFVTVITILCTLSKRSTPESVFKTLHTDAGWENPGVAFSIGLLTVAYPISMFDGVMHMSK